MADRLTIKQKAFVLALPVANFNGTEAAALAGYKGSRETLASIASENLRKPKIRAAIDTMLKERAMSANEVLWRLTDQARARYSDYFESYALKDAEGNEVIQQPFFDFERCKADGNLHLIKKIKYKDGQPAEVEFHDAQTALIKLGQVHGLFKDEQPAVDVNVNVAVAADDLARSRERAQAFEDELLSNDNDD